MKNCKKNIRAIATTILMVVIFSLASSEATAQFGNNYLLDPNYAMWQATQQMNELNRINQQLINTSIWQTNNGINLGGTYCPPATNSSTTSNQSTSTHTHTCGLCGGSGETIKTDGVSFGNTKYCSKCNKTVPDYHYHSTCESCKGKGRW